MKDLLELLRTTVWIAAEVNQGDGLFLKEWELKFLFCTLKNHCPLTACDSPLKYMQCTLFSMALTEVLYLMLSWVKAVKRASLSVADLRKATVTCQWIQEWICQWTYQNSNTETPERYLSLFLWHTAYQCMLKTNYFWQVLAKKSNHLRSSEKGTPRNNSKVRVFRSV